jgi:GDP-4-dehydro-6-deoxy-D-mannose reductase
LRVLITGASGLAGGHLARACSDAGDEVIGVSRRGTLAPDVGTGVALDLRDAAGVRELIRHHRPQVAYHLAALSSVGRSWEDPARTLQDNVTSAVNLLEALRHESPETRTVWASSCEVYGPSQRLPIEESAALNPANPYAVSKTTGDLLAGLYVDAHGLPIVRARPFNHAGPGQMPMFILSSLARQGAEARRAGVARIEIVTGNPDTRRDFTDARDVARAYRMLAEHADPGVYNVCTGHSVSAAEQVALLAELIAPIEVEHVVDPARVRPHEVMDLRGSPVRIEQAVGWRPEITLRQTMLDTMTWWERELAKSGAPIRLTRTRSA